MHWDVGDACYCGDADHYTSCSFCITFYSYNKDGELLVPEGEIFGIKECYA